MNKQASGKIWLYLSITTLALVLLSSGCTLPGTEDFGGQSADDTNQYEEPKKTADVTLELLDAFPVSKQRIVEDPVSVQEEIRDNHSWVYSKEGLKKDIGSNSTFIIRAHMKYPITNKEGYSSGTRVTVKYYPDYIGFLKPLSPEYEPTDSYLKAGPEGGDQQVRVFRYGSCGELRRGEEQEMVFIGSTKNLQNLNEAVTPVHVSLTVYRDELVGASLPIRIMKKDSN